MEITTRYLRALLLIGAIAAPVATIGCAARVRVYDVGYRDYHHWNADEDRHYRVYLQEKHENYRDFKERNKDEQQDYWKWRHDH